MDEQIIHLHRSAPAKPPVGAPCNGCGVCCAVSTCPVARLRFLRASGPCPALAWSAEQGRYLCGLLHSPGRYFSWLPGRAEDFARRLLSRWIAAGIGCDCDVEVGNQH